MFNNQNYRQVLSIISDNQHSLYFYIFAHSFLDILQDIDGNPIAGEIYYDVRHGGEPGYVYYPKPGAISMRHGYLVNALRKKAMAQESWVVVVFLI